MKIYYNGDYYKTLDIPKTYENFLEKLPNICYPQKIPPKYKLSYLDQENFRITISYGGHYQTMLEVMKSMTKEIIVIITPVPENDNEQSLSIENILSMIQPQWLQAQGNEQSRSAICNSPRTTQEESSMGNDIDTALRPDTSGQSQPLLLESKRSTTKLHINTDNEEKPMQNSNEIVQEFPSPVGLVIKDPKLEEVRLKNENYVEEIKENPPKANEKKNKRSQGKELVRRRDPNDDNENLVEQGDKVVIQSLLFLFTFFNLDKEGSDFKCEKYEV